MLQNAHLNRISGAIRFGHSLDRRGILRVAAILSGAAVSDPHVAGAGSLEFRPLEPHRVTPILGAGGGLLFSLFPDGGTPRHSFAFLTAGVAVRVAGALSLTVRGLYGDGDLSSRLYSLHAGFEVGR